MRDCKAVQLSAQCMQQLSVCMMCEQAVYRQGHGIAPVLKHGAIKIYVGVEANRQLQGCSCVACSDSPGDVLVQITVTAIAGSQTSFV